MVFKVAMKIIDADYPGWAEGRFYDAWGIEHIIQDKIPVFTNQAPDPSDSLVPLEGWVRCTFLNERISAEGKKVVTVSTEYPDHIESTAGLFEFDLPENRIAP